MWSDGGELVIQTRGPKFESHQRAFVFAEYHSGRAGSSLGILFGQETSKDESYLGHAPGRGPGGPGHGSAPGGVSRPSPHIS